MANHITYSPFNPNDGNIDYILHNQSVRAFVPPAQTSHFNGTNDEVAAEWTKITVTDGFTTSGDTPYQATLYESGVVTDRYQMSDNYNFARQIASSYVGLSANPITGRVGGSNGNTPVPQSVTMLLSSADILALRATPIEIAPAPGSGKIIVPYLVIFSYGGDGATPYDVSGGGSIELLYDATSFPNRQLVIDSFILTSAANDSWLPDPARSIFDTKFTNTDFVNKPLMLQNNGAGEYTIGTGAASITVCYNIVTIVTIQ